VKTKSGVSITAFRDFFVKDGQVFSIIKVATFNGTESYALLKQFVKENLIKSRKFREILIICNCYLNMEVVAHAGTFLRQENSDGDLILLKYYDPNENHFFERGDYPIDYKKLFDRFSLITVHALDGRPVKSAAEETKINNKMGRIMTGNIDYIHESKVRAGIAGNQSNARTNKGWRTGTDTNVKIDLVLSDIDIDF